jgi:hypothetical protein
VNILPSCYCLVTFLPSPHLYAQQNICDTHLRPFSRPPRFCKILVSYFKGYFACHLTWKRQHNLSTQHYTTRASELGSEWWVTEFTRKRRNERAREGVRVCSLALHQERAENDWEHLVWQSTKDNIHCSNRQFVSIGVPAGTLSRHSVVFLLVYSTTMTLLRLKNTPSRHSAAILRLVDRQYNYRGFSFWRIQSTLSCSETWNGAHLWYIMWYIEMEFMHSIIAEIYTCLCHACTTAHKNQFFILTG